MRKNNLNAVLVVIGISLVLILLFIGRENLVSLATSPDPTKVPTSTLLREIRTINVPYGHTAVDPIKTWDKVVTVGATRHFRASSSAAEIADAYKTSLPEQGWTFVGERSVSGNEIALKFCRGATSLILNLVSEDPGTTYYYLGVQWAKSKNSRAYCR